MLIIADRTFNSLAFLNFYICLIAQISALNGVRMESEEGQLLHPFDFAVLTCHVLTPRKLVFETDFLERVSSINFLSRSQHSVHPVQIRVVDEDTIWQHYARLPAGCMFLQPVDPMDKYSGQ
jgi:hypothetical protein